MKIKLTVIKADIGSIGGHLKPSSRIFEWIQSFVQREGEELVIDSYVSFTGDDIAIQQASHVRCH